MSEPPRTSSYLIPSTSRGVRTPRDNTAGKTIARLLGDLAPWAAARTNPLPGDASARNQGNPGLNSPNLSRFTTRYDNPARRGPPRREPFRTEGRTGSRRGHRHWATENRTLTPGPEYRDRQGVLVVRNRHFQVLRRKTAESPDAVSTKAETPCSEESSDSGNRPSFVSLA